MSGAFLDAQCPKCGKRFGITMSGFEWPHEPAQPIKPTQAQIAAAAKAIRTVLQGDRNSKSAEALAEAALTAAAQVKEPPT